MSDVLREKKGASKWGDYDVYDLMSDKKLFYEDLTDFGWEEFYKFKKRRAQKRGLLDQIHRVRPRHAVYRY